jgi:broad specificity phosphatase PhoE
VSLAFLVRHGKASAFTSSLDYDELSPPGVEQSARLGEWLAAGARPFDAVFLGPRKRHAQTHAAVAVAFATQGRPLPDPVVLPELDEHDGIALVFKLLPSLAAEDALLRGLVEGMARGGRPSPEGVLEAFKRVTRRWVRGEIGHDDVESWPAFRSRVERGMARIGAIGRGKAALVFTSAGAIAAAVGASLGIRDEEKVLDLSWSLYNASTTELDFAGDRWGLRSFNVTAHLCDPGGADQRLITSV